MFLRFEYSAVIILVANSVSLPDRVIISYHIVIIMSIMIICDNMAIREATECQSYSQ